MKVLLNIFQGQNLIKIIYFQCQIKIDKTIPTKRKSNRCKKNYFLVLSILSKLCDAIDEKTEKKTTKIVSC